MNTITFLLEPVAPFRLDLTVLALRRRMDNVIDRWDGETYRRLLIIGNKPVAVAVEQVGPINAPRLRVAASGDPTSKVKANVIAVLNRLLGLRIDLEHFYNLAARDARLAGLVDKLRGLKPPRYPSIFEALVNGIICQQFTLTNGIRTLNRLALACGVSPDGYNHAFPRPSDLISLEPAALRELKLSWQKIRALTELSRGVINGTFDSEHLSKLNDETAITRLTDLWGVGRWTAEYALLRGLGRLHIFPCDDVGARNNLAKWLGRREPFDYAGAKRALSKWNPFAGLIYFHLLVLGLETSESAPWPGGRPVAESPASLLNNVG